MGPRDFCAFLHQRLRRAKRDARHHLAARLPFAAILTTNYDTFVEDASWDRPDVINQRKLPELMRELHASRSCVVHMHGDVSDVQSIVLSAADYDILKKDEHFAHYVHTLASSYTFLFVGCSLQQDEDFMLFLDQVFQKAAGLTGPHYALQHVSKCDGARREEYDKKYGIRFLEDHSDKVPDIEAFLRSLRATLP